MSTFELSLQKSLDISSITLVDVKKCPQDLVGKSEEKKRLCGR
jgi:hypothetical protein